MPNWCSNTFFVYGNKAGCIRFYLKLQSLLESHDSSGGSRLNLWDTLKAAGYDDSELSGINCRGDISDLNLEEEIEEGGRPFGVKFWAESAWSPCSEAITLLINKLAPRMGLKSVFLAEEPGCEIYINSDVDGVYFRDFANIDTNDDVYYYETGQEEEFLKFIFDNTGVKYETVGEARSDDKFYEKTDAGFRKKMSKLLGVAEDSEDLDDYYFNIHFFEEY